MKIIYTRGQNLWFSYDTVVVIYIKTWPWSVHLPAKVFMRMMLRDTYWKWLLLAVLTKIMKMLHKPGEESQVWAFLHSHQLFRLSSPSTLTAAFLIGVILICRIKGGNGSCLSGRTKRLGGGGGVEQYIALGYKLHLPIVSFASQKL